MPWRSIAGMIRNIGNVGRTYLNVDCACAAIRSASLVSCHSQIMPRIETSGSDTMSAPRLGERRATSESNDDAREGGLDAEIEHESLQCRPPESPQGQSPPGIQAAPEGSSKTTVAPDKGQFASQIAAGGSILLGVPTIVGEFAAKRRGFREPEDPREAT